MLHSHCNKFQQAENGLERKKAKKLFSDTKIKHSRQLEVSFSINKLPSI